MKKCPFCAEVIQNESVKCKYCQGYITNVATVNEEQRSLYCSFCHRSRRELKNLIAGPEVYICDECIDLCYSIVHEDNDAIAVDGKIAE